MSSPQDLSLGDLERDPDVVSQVVTTYYRTMVHYAMRSYLVDLADAEGLVQQVFLELWMARCQGIRKPEVPVHVWLFQRLRQRCLNYAERDRHRQTHSAAPEAGWRARQLVSSPAAAEERQDELIDCLRQGVAQRLHGRTQEVIQLYIAGHSPTQIAEQLHVSAARVSQLLHKGIWLLRTWLQEQGWDHEG
jgi:RNA polymerase sigma factor (sigma-70 family)